MDGAWGGGQEKGTEGIQQGSLLNSRKDGYAFCRYPPSPIGQTLVMFLLVTQRREVSVFYTPAGTFQGTHLLCPNAPAPKCQVVSQELIHLTSL